MPARCWRSTFALATATLFVACATAPHGIPTRWRKVVVDPSFRSEAVAVADVDRDGDPDLLVGDGWYEAPTWRLHAIREPADYGDGRTSYSRCFACFAADLDADGQVDQIVVGMPGTPVCWYHNPGAAAGPWPCSEIHPCACNESPAFVDLFGDGRRVLLMGDGESLVWCEPGADPRTPWVVHPVSLPHCPAAQRFAHGLGVGDMDGDGRLDVLSPHGIWRQPPGARSSREPWPEDRLRICLDSAHLHAMDVDDDGLADVVHSSAHGRGVGWSPQRRDERGATFFTLRPIADHVTQTHALCMADIDGDGTPDFVTGKRWWAHGPDGDIDPSGTPWLFWVRVVRGREPAFEVHPIDDDSGVGTQFAVADVDGDGRLDVVVANKRGVHLLLQQP